MRPVMSDQHLGLKAAIEMVFIGAAWQRFRVHLFGNALAQVPKAKSQIVAVDIRTTFAQPDQAHISRQCDEVVNTLRHAFPAVASVLIDTKADLLARSAIPVIHWRRIWSTNPLERVYAEIKRRSNVVDIFPNNVSELRRVIAVLVEQDDEQEVAERQYQSEESMTRIDAAPEPGIERPSMALAITASPTIRVKNISTQAIYTTWWTRSSELPHELSEEFSQFVVNQFVEPDSCRLSVFMTGTDFANSSENANQGSARRAFIRELRLTWRLSRHAPRYRA